MERHFETFISHHRIEHESLFAFTQSRIYALRCYQLRTKRKAYLRNFQTWTTEASLLKLGFTHDSTLIRSNSSQTFFNPSPKQLEIIEFPS